MPLSQKKKRERRKFKAWRIKNKVRNCKKCGKRLTGETHHFYCNKCHKTIKETKRLIL